MSRFNNTNVNTTKTANLAGGQAYKESYELELVSILCTSFLEDSFYRSGSDTMERLVELVRKVDPIFAAKAALFARNEFGMRSVSHVVAVEIAKLVKNEPWTKYFFRNIIHRPDDMQEILALYLKKYGKPIPSSLKRGFALSFHKFNSYSLAKYRGEKKEVSLVDIVNLVHPVPTEKNAEALKALVLGKLRSDDTWESLLTKAGQDSEDGEISDKKKDVWQGLIAEKKLGHFALLRNLRNIAKQAPDILNDALEQLCDENVIKNSLVLPFRYATAANTINYADVQPSQKNAIIQALDKAATISLNNVPALNGKTLVALDNSGSMNGRPAEIGSLFAAILYKKLDCDVIVFSDTAKYVTPNPSNGVLSIANYLLKSVRPSGTNFISIFNAINTKYDRIIILSDMQAWVNSSYYASRGNAVQSAYKKMCSKTSTTPKLWSFDLKGYGTLQFPENNVYTLAGFSEKIFDIMSSLEEDKYGFVRRIKNTEIHQ